MHIYFSTCNDSLYCKHHSLLVEKKTATMYNTYLFIRECIKLSNVEIHRYSNYLLHNLYLTE